MKRIIKKFGKPAILLIIPVVFSFNLNGQAIKINGSGKVGINGDPSSSYNLKVNGSLWTTGVITSSSNLYVSNIFPNYNHAQIGNDMLNMGIGVSWASDATLKISGESTYALYVDGRPRTTNSWWETSDERLKKDINPMDPTDILGKLRYIEGKKYKFKSDEELTQLHNSRQVKFAYDTTRVLDTVTNTEKVEVKLHVPNYPKGENYGLLAQDIKSYFPELVMYDSLDMTYCVNYTGFIPILITAVNGQQALIAEQGERIASLERELEKLKNKKGLKSAGVGDVNDNSKDEAVLLQNSPNPFSVSTKIEYYLPDDIKTAKIYIYDMNGAQLKSIPLNQKGNGSITINGNELKAGMYMYSLIADGQVVDTKRMILTD